MAAKKKAKKKVAAKKSPGRRYSEEYKKEVLDFAVANDEEKRGAVLAREKYGHSINVIRGWAEEAGVELKKRFRGRSAGPISVARKVNRIPTTEELEEEFDHLRRAEELVVEAREQYAIARKQLSELEKAHENALKRIRKRLF